MRLTPSRLYRAHLSIRGLLGIRLGSKDDIQIQQSVLEDQVVQRSDTRQYRSLHPAGSQSSQRSPEDAGAYLLGGLD